MPTRQVVLPMFGSGSDSSRYVLGPADLTGSAVARAESIGTTGGQYEVSVTFTPAGAQQFDAVAAQRYSFYQQNPANPPYQSLEAVDLDGQVLSAPAVQASRFNGAVVISEPVDAPFTLKQAEQVAGYIDAAAHY